MNNRLDHLIEQYFAGTLSDGELAELNAALQADPAALDYFIDQLDLHAALTEEAHLDVGAELSVVEAVADRAHAPRRRHTPKRLHRVERGRSRNAWGFVLVCGGLAAAAILMVAYVQGWFVAGTSGHPNTKVREVGESARTATVESVRGEVQCRVAFGEAHSLIAGETVAPGSTIETAADGELVLRYADSTTVAVRSDSVVAFSTDGSGKILRLNRGVLAAEVAPQPTDTPMEVIGDFARARVVGTQFQFTNTETLTGLTVFHGAVEFERASDGTKLVVKGEGYGQVAQVGPGVEFRVTSLDAPSTGGAIPVGAAVQRGLSDDFSAEQHSAKLWRWLNPEGPNRVIVADGVLQLRAVNSDADWQNYYAVTRQALPMEPMTIQLRVKIPAQASNLVAAVSLLSNEDSGRGERENLELLFRGNEIELRRVTYPNGSKNGTHAEVSLAPAVTGLWRPAEWIAVVLVVDATRIQATVNGRELFEGVHGMTDWNSLRLGLYAGLKMSDQERVVEIDSVSVVCPAAPGTKAGPVPGNQALEDARGRNN